MINGNIGGTANNDVGNITIGATGHNGNITLSGDIGTDSVAGAAVVALGNANTGLITLGGAEYNTSGTQTYTACLLYTSPSPRDTIRSRMRSSA